MQPSRRLICFEFGLHAQAFVNQINASHAIQDPFTVPTPLPDIQAIFEMVLRRPENKDLQNPKVATVRDHLVSALKQMPPSAKREIIIRELAAMQFTFPWELTRSIIKDVSLPDLFCVSKDFRRKVSSEMLMRIKKAVSAGYFLSLDGVQQDTYAQFVAFRQNLRMFYTKNSPVREYYDREGKAFGTVDHPSALVNLTRAVADYNFEVFFDATEGESPTQTFSTMEEKRAWAVQNLRNVPCTLSFVSGIQLIPPEISFSGYLRLKCLDLITLNNLTTMSVDDLAVEEMKTFDFIPFEILRMPALSKLTWGMAYKNEGGRPLKLEGIENAPLGLHICIRTALIKNIPKELEEKAHLVCKTCQRRQTKGLSFELIPPHPKFTVVFENCHFEVSYSQIGKPASPSLPVQVMPSTT